MSSNYFLGLRINDTLFNKLQDLEKETGRTKSSLVRDILTEYFEIQELSTSDRLEILEFKVEKLLNGQTD